MNIAVYDIETGKIEWFIVCPPEVVMEQTNDRFEIYLNCPQEATHIIDHLPVMLS